MKAMDIVGIVWIPGGFKANNRYRPILEFGVSVKAIKVVINISSFSNRS